ncbi:hypothetical protein [Staphylococcus aureus]|nr:hypothetical protein [Staphylococcus aureus]
MMQKNKVADLTIDEVGKDLLPYIEGVELHQYDYKGLNGFDKNYDAKK